MSGSTLTVRHATLADAPTIVEFNIRLARDTEGLELDPAVVREGVRRMLEDAQRGRMFVAEVDGRVVGQTMFTYEWSDWRNSWIWWLQSVYVEEAHRRRGVFRALYAHVRELARDDPEVGCIRLYVERRNVVARETYLGLGMTLSGHIVLEEDWSAARRS
jgi:GNAT superfamily N-acetyltransferase